MNLTRITPVPASLWRSMVAIGAPLFALGGAAFAAPRTSADYTIAIEDIDGGGGRATSVDYTHDGSAGGITGISGVVSPAETAKHGYVAQLFDMASLLVGAAAPIVNESATLQLGVARLLDDGSVTVVNTSLAAWSITGGPILSISTAGVATVGIVPQDTPATVQATFAGFTNTYTFTVLDTLFDNWGSYAGDGVGDDWQIQYFGLNNPNAGPNVDFNRTGQTNLFKYIAGLNPLDSNSRFILKTAPVPGQPGQKRIIFSPLAAGRIYTVKAKPSLLTLGGWSAITASAPSDNGLERTITDLNATEAEKFYQIEITKP